MSGRSFDAISWPSADFSPSDAPVNASPTAAEAHEAYEAGLKGMQPVPADKPQDIDLSPYAHEAATLQRIHAAVGVDLATFNRAATFVCRPILPEQPDLYEIEVKARMAETTRVFES